MQFERLAPRQAVVRAPRLLALCAALALVPAALALETTGDSAPGVLDSRAPIVTAVYPTGGELFTSAVVETLRWTVDEDGWGDPEPLTVTLLDGVAVLDQFTLAPTPGGVYALPWSVSDINTTNARMAVSALDGFGWSGADTSGTFAIQPSTTDAPDAFLVDRIGPVQPNPFNPSTSIAFTLQSPADLSLTVFDVRGRALVELASGRWETGRHAVRWDGRDRDGRQAPSGAYFARLSLRGEDRAESLVTRLTLVK